MIKPVELIEIRVLAFYLFLVFTFASCSQNPESQNILIAASKAKPLKSYGAYSEWLNNIDSTVEVVDLYHMPVDSALIILKKCSGLLLTGGPDIFPGYYEKSGDTAKCETIDRKRDTLEMELFRLAHEMDMPVLGICRGLQLINVSLKGSLFADIPQDYDTIVKHRSGNAYSCFHIINILSGSYLANICQANSGMVNSAHHQGIDKLAPMLQGVAYAEDSLIEALTWKSGQKSYLLAVQWHPERMEPDSPFSYPIGESFINAAKEYKNSRYSSTQMLILNSYVLQ